MANEFRKVTDQNGVDHPVCDDTRVDWASHAVLGAKNKLQNTAITTTNGGTTWTVNSDKTITTSGLAGGNNTILVNNFTFKAGVEYILSGTPEGGGLNSGIFVRANSADYSVNLVAEPEGRLITFDTDTTLQIQCRVPTGDNTSRTFKSMIRLASDTDPTYQPYAMTNKELTDAILNGESYGNVIAISASGQTWAAQLTEIKTAWDNLTLNQKRNAKIIVSGDIYICSNTDTGNFSSVAYAVDGSTPVINAKTLRLSSQTACKMLLKSTGNTVNDDSSSTNNDRMQLVSGI